MPFDIKYVDRVSELGKFLYSWWAKSTLNRHGYLKGMSIKGIWEIFRDDKKFKQKREIIKSSRNNERPLFQDEIKKSDLDKNANVNWLFHGTRSCNLLSILKDGLRLPRQLSGVTITGALFGPGVYWADDWKKSAGYTSLGNSYWSQGSGKIANRSAFMFTGEVILGDIYVSGYGYSKAEPPGGYHSVMGSAGKSGVANNEFIVYNTDQCKIRYLVEFDA